MIESKTLLEILDLKRNSHQDAIASIINSALKDKKLPLVIQLLSQLKEYLQKQCSFYPLDFHAECAQYETNFPYRDSKMKSLIRKMNFKGDHYPLYLG